MSSTPAREDDELLLDVYYVDDLIMFYPPNAVDADDVPVADSIYGRFIADMDGRELAL